MITLEEIPSDKKIEIYTQIYKELFLKELQSNGYDKGFNFDHAKIIFNDGKGYNVPKYVGQLRIKNRDLYYVPQGEKFERFFELYFTEYQGQVEVKKRERDADVYFSPKGKTYEEEKNIIEQYTNKGFYPGQAYFQTEITDIKRSLRKHQDKIIEQLESSEFQIDVDNMGPLADMELTLYQISEETVYIRAWGTSPVEFFYNIQKGIISNAMNISPPSPA